MADNINVERIDEFGDAPSVNSNGASAAQQNAGAPKQEQKPQYIADAPETQQSFFDILSGCSLTTSLKEDGKRFLATIDAAMSDRNFLTKFSNWKVEVLPLTSVRDSRAIIVNGKSVVLIMSETNGTDANFPVARYEPKACEELFRLRPGTNNLLNIIITPEDYVNADKFAEYLKNIFMVANRGHGLTLGMIRKDTIFTFDDIAEHYEQAYREINPHAVPLRHDLCLTVYAQAANRNFNNYGRIGTEADTYLRDNQSEKQAFATIGGYVEFLKTSAYTYKYMPIVHISEIATKYPDEALIPLFLIVAAKWFIGMKQWITPYRQMKADVHGNAINLGSLFPDGQGGRWVITKPEDFDKTIASSFTSPQLVLDIPDGRANIPGLSRYCDSSTLGSIMQLYANTFGATIPPLSIPPFASGCPFYRGFYSYGEKKLDSACIDFLSEYTRKPNRVDDCEQLLIPRANPEERAVIDRKFEGDLKLYYRTAVVRIDPAILYTLDDIMSKQHFQFNGLTQMNNLYDTSGYIANANSWDNYLKSRSAGQFNTYNPTAGFYNFN